jgi:hypothetical protein
MGARFDVPFSCSLSGINASQSSSARQLKNSLLLICGSRKDREPIQDKPAGISAPSDGHPRPRCGPFCLYYDEVMFAASDACRLARAVQATRFRKLWLPTRCQGGYK